MIAIVTNGLPRMIEGRSYRAACYWQPTNQIIITVSYSCHNPFNLIIWMLFKKGGDAVFDDDTDEMHAVSDSV
jgi:hypothetical protein